MLTSLIGLVLTILVDENVKFKANQHSFPWETSNPKIALG